MYRKSEKNFLNSNTSSTCSHSQYGELRPTRPNGWDRLASLGHPSKFQRVSLIDFVTAATSLNGNFARSFAVSCVGSLYIHFGGCCPLTEFWKAQSLLCVQVLRSTAYWQRYCTALQQCVSQTLHLGQRKESRNLRHLHSAGRPSGWASTHSTTF